MTINLDFFFLRKFCTNTFLLFTHFVVQSHTFCETLHWVLYIWQALQGQNLCTATQKAKLKPPVAPSTPDVGIVALELAITALAIKTTTWKTSYPLMRFRPLWLTVGHWNSPPCYVAFGDRHFVTSLAGRQRAEQATANTSCSQNVLFSKLCVHKQCSQCSSSCVETPVILPAKFHVVLSLLSVKIF